jgi:aconitate hydratase
VPLGDPLGETVAGPVITKAGDDITTDHIIPADPDIISLWSDPQTAADYTLIRVDEAFPEKAREAGGGWIVAGENWGQGSSRENAAIELVVLDVHGVIAKSFARIHFENLINFGVVPLRLADPAVYDRLDEGRDLNVVGNVADQIEGGVEALTVAVDGDWTFRVVINLTPDQRATLTAGGKLAALQAANE